MKLLWHRECQYGFNAVTKYSSLGVSGMSGTGQMEFTNEAICCLAVSAFKCHHTRSNSLESWFLLSRDFLSLTLSCCWLSQNSTPCFLLCGHTWCQQLLISNCYGLPLSSEVLLIWSWHYLLELNTYSQPRLLEYLHILNNSGFREIVLIASWIPCILLQLFW